MRSILVLLVLLCPLTAASGESPLRAFDFLAGHCWRGEFANGAVNTHCFTWVFGGKHLRDVHIVRGGGPDYRGETIYSVDRETGGVIFRYWNSLGGVIDGRIEIRDGALISPGERYVGDDGVAREFRSTMQRLDTDRYVAVTEELVGGQWSESSRVEFTRGAAATACTDPGDP